MGTSISQSSQRNSSNWKRVFVCYGNNSIPESRVVNEVWRASDNESTPMSSLMKSDIIYSCYNAVKNSKNHQEALAKINQTITEAKNNSMIAEFAKRVVPIAFQSNDPSSQWTKSFFSEVTNYVVSRDTSGFVGEKYRNKSVKELIEFKRDISNRVAQIINADNQQINSNKEWNSFVDQSISKLKTN